MGTCLAVLLLSLISREVVRPSPDLLYSACPFDLSRGPLRITAAVPDSYFSISAFADNTDNFFVINDRQIKAARVELTLARQGSDYRGGAGERVVRSPSDEGILLVRTLIKDRRDFKKLQQVQHQADCRPGRR